MVSFRNTVKTPNKKEMVPQSRMFVFTLLQEQQQLSSLSKWIIKEQWVLASNLVGNPDSAVIRRSSRGENSQPFERQLNIRNFCEFLEVLVCFGWVLLIFTFF